MCTATTIINSGDDDPQYHTGYYVTTTTTNDATVTLSWHRCVPPPPTQRQRQQGWRMGSRRRVSSPGYVFFSIDIHLQKIIIQMPAPCCHDDNDDSEGWLGGSRCTRYVFSIQCHRFIYYSLFCIICIYFSHYSNLYSLHEWIYLASTPENVTKNVILLMNWWNGKVKYTDKLRSQKIYMLPELFLGNKKIIAPGASYVTIPNMAVWCVWRQTCQTDGVFLMRFKLYSTSNETMDYLCPLSVRQ